MLFIDFGKENRSGIFTVCPAFLTLHPIVRVEELRKYLQFLKTEKKQIKQIDKIILNFTQDQITYAMYTFEKAIAEDRRIVVTVGDVLTLGYELNLWNTIIDKYVQQCFALLITSIPPHLTESWVVSFLHSLKDGSFFVSDQFDDVYDIVKQSCPPRTLNYFIFKLKSQNPYCYQDDIILDLKPSSDYYGNKIILILLNKIIALRKYGLTNVIQFHTLFSILGQIHHKDLSMQIDIVVLKLMLVAATYRPDIVQMIPFSLRIAKYGFTSSCSDQQAKLEDCCISVITVCSNHLIHIICDSPQVKYKVRNECISFFADYWNGILHHRPSLLQILKQSSEFVSFIEENNDGCLDNPEENADLDDAFSMQILFFARLLKADEKSCSILG